MHYMTRKSHQMQKHKFVVTCPSVLFMETAPSPPEHEKDCVDVLRPQMHRNALRDPQILPDANTQFWLNVS
jgi:hypothetical protein